MKRKRIKSIVAVALSAVMLCSSSTLFDASVLTASAASAVTYRNGKVLTNNTVKWETKTVTDYKILTDEVTNLDGWYVVDSDTVITHRLNVKCKKTAHIIIKDNTTLNCTKGIFVEPMPNDSQEEQYGSLYIYSQTADNKGTLISKGTESCAGIGGNDGTGNGYIQINGCTINATGGKFGSGIGMGDGPGGGAFGNDKYNSNSIDILDGVITATGGDKAAGIGGGNYATCPKLNIYGGKITAKGGRYGAGIGGGNYGSIQFPLTIYDSKYIYAEGGENAAGIGGGDSGELYSSITIEKCDNLEARGGPDGAGIGTGDGTISSNGTINIHGGNIIATSSSDGDSGGAGIGGGGGYVFGLPTAITINISGGNIYAMGGQGNRENDGGAAIGSGCGSDLDGEINISGGTIRAISQQGGAAIGAGAEAGIFSGGGDYEDGEINITGGTIYAYAKSIYSSQIIGCGHDGTDEGKFTLGSNLAVKQNVNANLDEGYYVASANRISACKGKDRRNGVLISPCTHPDSERYHYVTTGSHQLRCRACDYAISDYESHITGFTDMKNTCTVCGYDTDAHTVTVLPPEGSQYTELVPPGKTFIFPRLTEITTNMLGRVNKNLCWHIDDDDTDYAPGDRITVNKSLTVRAFHVPVQKIVTNVTTSGGTAAPKTEYGASGEKVYLDIEPEIGYEVDTVTPASQRAEVEIANGEYAVIMPSPIDNRIDAELTVFVSFKSAERTIVFDPGQGTGDSHSVSVLSNDTLQLEEFAFTAPEGMIFDGWSYNGSVYPAGYKIPAVREDMTFVAVYVPEEEGINERLEGYSLSLDGDIGVNFYMELDEDTAASETAYMQFTLSNGKAQRIPVNKATKKMVDGKTCYVFKCNVAAKEMTLDIKAQMIDGENQGTEYTYTVKDYADYLLSHSSDSEAYEKAAPLVKAMLNYGTYSQIYFGTNPDQPANAILDDAEKVLGEVTVIHKDAVSNDLPEGVTFEGASLSIESETGLSLYFKNKSSKDVTFKLGDEEITPVENNGFLQIRITGIKAKQLSSDFTVTVGNSGTVTYSPMNYCINVLKGDYSESLKNVVKALYLYSQAADNYSA